MIQYGVDPQYHGLHAKLGERWWKVRVHPGLGRVVLERTSNRTDTDRLQPLTPDQFSMVVNIGGRPRPAGMEMDVVTSTKAMVRIAELFGFPVLNPRAALVQGYVGVVGDKAKDSFGAPPVLEFSRKLGDYVKRRVRHRRNGWVSETEQAIDEPSKEGDTEQIVKVGRSYRSGNEPMAVTKVRLNAFGRPGMIVSQVMAVLGRAESATCAVARMLQAEYGARIEVLPDGSARRETKAVTFDEWEQNNAS
jgi:hypothetical protein